MADIFRQYGPAYLQKYGERIPQRHHTVMQKIQTCRTEELGGEIFLCEPCQEYRYSYHSCQDRHCPKCSNSKADEWLKMQSALLLPVTYFMLTFTLPDTLNPATAGHFIVAGGGLSPDGTTWLPVRGKFLVPVKALSKIFRAKFRDALKKKPELFSQVPSETWKKDWVVDCRPVGSGESRNAGLKYLAPYIFRVAISNRRLLKLENGNVTFQYRDGDTKQFKTRTVTAEEFIRRFLQHILPHRFIKVRYYGFLASSHRKRLEKVKALLNVEPVATEPTFFKPVW
ncbi:MAG: IS91 family transposase [bacterium]